MIADCCGVYLCRTRNAFPGKRLAIFVESLEDVFKEEQAAARRQYRERVLEGVCQNPRLPEATMLFRMPALPFLHHLCRPNGQFAKRACFAEPTTAAA